MNAPSAIPASDRPGRSRGVALRAALWSLLLLLLVHGTAGGADAPAYSTDFAIPEVEESPFEFWGQAEWRMFGRILDKDSAAYRQRFFKDPQEDLSGDALLSVKPEFSLQFREVGAYLRPRLDLGWSGLPLTSGALDAPSRRFFEGDRHWGGAILLEEGFVTWRPTPSFTLETGKKVLKWGKGYAWNAVNFAARPKDVDDPDQSREGYVMAYADAILSLQGPLATVALTPVLLPVAQDLNTNLAPQDSLLYGGKLTLLLWDTDLDFLAMAGHGYDTRLGLDFARNLAENLVLHGEAALRLGYEQPSLDTLGRTQVERFDAFSFLVGLRYLTPSDTTFILEYFHNGEGYSPREMATYICWVERGYDRYLATGQAGLLQQSAPLAGDYFSSSAGRDYLYFRVSQKEPLDILYLTPTMTVIANLGDGSFSLNPELSYMLTSDLELRPRLIIPVGAPRSEFGEKLNTLRGELRLTWYF